MTDLATIQELYRYNRWANDRVFERVAKLPTEDFTRDLGSSYPSIRDTAPVHWSCRRVSGRSSTRCQLNDSEKSSRTSTCRDTPGATLSGVKWSTS